MHHANARPRPALSAPTTGCDRCRNWTCGPGASTCPDCGRIHDTNRAEGRALVRGGAIAKPELAALAVIGVRAEGEVLVVVESGGIETRCSSSAQLWETLTRIAAGRASHVVDARSGSQLKRDREDLAKAGKVLLGKAREHAADRVGEDTVDAVSTVGRILGAPILGALRKRSIRGSSSLGHASRGLPPPERRRGSG